MTRSPFPFCSWSWSCSRVTSKRWEEISSKISDPPATNSAETKSGIPPEPGFGGGSSISGPPALLRDNFSARRKLPNRSDPEGGGPSSERAERSQTSCIGDFSRSTFRNPEVCGSPSVDECYFPGNPVPKRRDTSVLTVNISQ